MRYANWIAAASLLVLSACGPLNSGGIGTQLGEVAREIAAGRQTGEAAAPAGPPADILEVPGKYIRVNVSNQGRLDTGVEAGENATRTTWIDGSNLGVTFENGIIVATRGLPGDLIAAEVSETWAAIRSGGGDAKRTHEFLTNLDGISTELLQCRIDFGGIEEVRRLGTSQDGRRFDEKCTGASFIFTNVYWLNRDGDIIRSLQAISPQAGYLQIDVF